MSPKPLVIAHRGASAYRPENTSPAFELAVEQGADMIETDLHRTADGVIVLAHDAELERIGGKGEIADTAFAELRRLDAGGGEPVPTLDETLDRFGGRIAFNLEFKIGRRRAHAGIEAAALDAVERRGLLERTLFSSFHDEFLVRLRERSATARIGALVSRHRPEAAIERARNLRAEALHPEAVLLTAEWVKTAHAAGFAVHPFTVDTESEMRRHLSLGVDGLFTNVPDRMRAIVDGAS